MRGIFGINVLPDVCVHACTHVYTYVHLCVRANIEMERDVKKLAHETMQLANPNFAGQASRLETRDTADVAIQV